MWDDRKVATSPTTAAVSDKAELDKTFTDSKSLAYEILRLQGSHATPMTIIMRQAEWVQKATAEKLAPPTKPLDPATATPAQIANAVVWLKVGGYIPPAERQSDGGKAYVTSIVDAVTRQALTREIKQLGGKVPTGTPSLPELRKSVQDARVAADANEQAHRTYIGLDGRIGTEEQLVFYERTEALAAMYPDSTIGSLAANLPNVVSPGGPPDVQRMRDLGKLGDNTEAGFGHHAAATPVGKHAPNCNYPIR